MENVEDIRVLFVDDDKDFGDSLTKRLRKRNIEVFTADNAEQALSLFEENDINLILADIKLPGMDGVTLLEKIRNIDKKIPVILITGQGSLETAKKAIKFQVAEYILKPIESIEDLLVIMKKSLYGYNLFLKNRQLMLTLEKKVIELEQKNIALREIFKQIEIEKEQIKENINANVEKLIMPQLQKLKKQVMAQDCKTIEIMQKNLDAITTSFGKTVSRKLYKLTPKEIEICNMISNGLTSKEMAGILKIAPQTVERHRNNIREKMGLINKQVNLTTYLQNF